jgi:hypothetical protein
MDLGARQLVWGADLTLRRAARRRRRALLQELAAYRTTAERDDLLAAVDRCPSAGREEIRMLLGQAALRAERDRSPYGLRGRTG